MYAKYARYAEGMDSLDSQVAARVLREELSKVINRVAFGRERIGVTRHGKVAAVLVSVEDFELLEAFEMARDVADYDAAKAADDGTRVSLAELERELL